LLVDLLVKVHNFNRLILWQHLKETFALVSRLVLLHPKVVLEVEDASLEVLNFLSSSESGLSVDLLLEFIDLLHKQEAALDVREVVQSLDEIEDIVISVLGGIDVQEEQLLHVSELGLLLDKVLED